VSDPGHATAEEAEIARLNGEIARMRQRREETLKTALLEDLDFWPPDERPVVLARISGQLMEHISKRDTQRMRTVP
jgi:hypothetical protein